MHISSSPCTEARESGLIPRVACKGTVRTETRTDSLTLGLSSAQERWAQEEGRPTWHGVLGEVRQRVGEGDGAAPAGAGHAAGHGRGGHLPVDGGIVGEAACPVAHGHPALLWQGRCGAPLPEGCRIRGGGGGGAAQARVVGRGEREGGRGRGLVAGGTALPGQRWSPFLGRRVATIGHVPVQAGAARNHGSGPSQVPAQAGAAGAGDCVAMETGGQVALVGPGVPAQVGAPWSGGHAAMGAWHLVGPGMPAEAGAPRSGRRTTLVAGNHVAMETRAWRTHDLAVAQSGTAGSSHDGVDGPPPESRTRGSVGAHCPVAGLRAPGHTELRAGLAFRGGVELLE